MARLDEQKLLVCDGANGRGAALRTELIRAGAHAALAILGGSSPEVLLTRTIEELGRVDAVVIWPAEALTSTPLAQLSLAEWQTQVTAPLRATTLFLREQLGYWLSEGQGGDVIIVHGLDGGGALAALHSALEALVRSVAKEYGRRRVRCNLIAPGAGEEIRATARVVELALSPAFSFVTGQVLSAGSRGGSAS